MEIKEKYSFVELEFKLWKQKVLYERALELVSKVITDEAHMLSLNKVLEEIGEINQKWFEEKIKELQK